MKRVVILLLLFAFVIPISAGCASKKELKMYKEIVESLNQQITDKDASLGQKMKEIDQDLEKLNDKYYEEKLTQLLGTERLVYMAQEQWNYKLTVNGGAFRENFLRVSGKEVNIILTEEQLQNKHLPSAIHKSGCLTGNDENDIFHNHITIETNLTFEKQVINENSSIMAKYTLRDVPKGTTIVLVLTEPLRERLGLSFDRLEIVVDR